MSPERVGPSARNRRAGASRLASDDNPSLLLAARAHPRAVEPVEAATVESGVTEETKREQRVRALRKRRRPYATGLWLYQNAGWKPIPIFDRRGKGIVPPGFTGRHGEVPSDAQMEAWAKWHGGSNIALRLPRTHIGIDVDNYDGKHGGKTLAELERELGPLSPTLISTSRDDGVSGIRIYRLPEDFQDCAHWPNQAGPDIEVIWWGHRYVTVAPSIHNSGREYGWIPSPGHEFLADPPSPEELILCLDNSAEFPRAWCEYLQSLVGTNRAVSHSGNSSSGEVYADVDTAARLAEYRQGRFCSYIVNLRKKTDLDNAEPGERYNIARRSSFAIAAAGADGHTGAAKALQELEEAYVMAVKEDRGEYNARNEFQRLRDGAVVKFAGKEVPAEDPCGPLTSTKEGAGSVLGRELTRSALAKLPKPEPLIDGWLDLRTTVVVVGETGTNKTFAMLGWACSVVTGEAWLGHPVQISPATVLYVVGEGGFGLDDRIRAWEAEHKCVVPDDLIVYLQPYSIYDEEYWVTLTGRATELAARLVILDTLSSLAPDADEVRDAAQVIRWMSELAVAIDGTVVLVHHTGWEAKSRARGGSQLEANSDSVVVCAKASDNPESPVSIYRKKVKDGPAGARLWVRRVAIGASCVLELTENQGKHRESKSDEMKAAILQIIADSKRQLTRTEVSAALGGNREKGRKALDALISDCAVVVRKVPRAEGGRTVTREVVSITPMRRAREPSQPVP